MVDFSLTPPKLETATGQKLFSAFHIFYGQPIEVAEFCDALGKVLNEIIAEEVERKLNDHNLNNTRKNP